MDPHYKAAVAVCMATMMMLVLLHTTDARSDGPPVDIGTLCTDMTPQHRGTTQTSTPPYTITTSPSCYTPGQAVTGKNVNFTVWHIFSGSKNENTTLYWLLTLILLTDVYNSFTDGNGSAVCLAGTHLLVRNPSETLKEWHTLYRFSQFYLHTHAFIRERNEPRLLPFQSKLALILPIPEG